jgi:hypothetical protein
VEAVATLLKASQVITAKHVAFDEFDSIDGENDFLSRSRLARITEAKWAAGTQNSTRQKTASQKTASQQRKTESRVMSNHKCLPFKI